MKQRNLFLILKNFSKPTAMILEICFSIIVALRARKTVQQKSFILRSPVTVVASHLTRVKTKPVFRGTLRAGSSGGLSVMMDVQANNNTISEFSRGLRIMVHDQNTFINIDKGFNVYPGSHTLVRVTATKVIFIKSSKPFDRYFKFFFRLKTQIA